MPNNAIRQRLKALADPACKECDGDGMISIVYNNNPDREEDIACECVSEHVDIQDEPPDERDE